MAFSAYSVVDDNNARWSSSPLPYLKPSKTVFNIPSKKHTIYVLEFDNR